MTVEDEKKLAEYVLTRSLHSEDEIVAISNKLGIKRVTALLTNLDASVLDRKYPSGQPSLDDISRYARHLADSYSSDEIVVNAHTLERIIRVQYGETELAEGLSIEDIVPHQMLIAYDIFSSLNADDATLATVVNEALED